MLNQTASLQAATVKVGSGIGIPQMRQSNTIYSSEGQRAGELDEFLQEAQQVLQTGDCCEMIYLQSRKAPSMNKTPIDYGPGYRVYFVQRELELVILLAGGDKRTQDRDIQVALELARQM